MNWHQAAAFWGSMALGLFGWVCWAVVFVRYVAVNESYRELLLSTPPAPGQVWMHDTQSLHIIRVDTTGVFWSFQNPLDPAYHPQRSTHQDSWAEWRQRCQHRHMVLQLKRWCD
jgi:hypothetical protein